MPPNNGDEMTTGKEQVDHVELGRAWLEEVRAALEQVAPGDELARDLLAKLDSDPPQPQQGDCERCKGSGVELRQGPGEWIDDPCSACDGTGHKQPQHQEPQCGGSATAPSEVTEEEVEAAARAPFDKAGSEEYWDELDEENKRAPREDARLMLQAARRVSQPSGAKDCKHCENGMVESELGVWVQCRSCQPHPEVVYIARCPNHGPWPAGLHGARSRCFDCGGPVEQIPMIQFDQPSKVGEEGQ